MKNNLLNEIYKIRKKKILCIGDIILDSYINRDKLIHKLNQLGIELRPSFCSLSEMPPYRNFRKSLNLKNSYLLSKNGVSLPSSIMLNKIQLKFIVKSFADVLKKI